MAKKERYIKLDKDKVKEIADIKGVSTVTVSVQVWERPSILNVTLH